jgi:hypothetical protein
MAQFLICHFFWETDIFRFYSYKNINLVILTKSSKIRVFFIDTRTPD